MIFSENAHVLLSRTGFVRNLGMHFSKYRLKGRYESFAPLMVSSSNKAKRHGLSFDVASQPALPYVTTGSRLPWPGPHVPNNSTSPIFFTTNQWDFSRESEGNSSPPVVLSSQVPSQEEFGSLEISYWELFLLTAVKYWIFVGHPQVLHHGPWSRSVFCMFSHGKQRPIDSIDVLTSQGEAEQQQQQQQQRFWNVLTK